MKRRLWTFIVFELGHFGWAFLGVRCECKKFNHATRIFKLLVPLYSRVGLPRLYRYSSDPSIPIPFLEFTLPGLDSQKKFNHAMSSQIPKNTFVGPLSYLKLYVYACFSIFAISLGNKFLAKNKSLQEQKKVSFHVVTLIRGRTFVIEE